MTIFVEISRPVQWTPFRFDSESMRRYGWLWFAIGWLKLPFRRFCETAYDWSYSSVSRNTRQTAN